MRQACGAELASEAAAFIAAERGVPNQGRSRWQISHPGPQLAELYRTAPELAHAALDFVPVLSRHVETVLRGMLAVRSSTC